MGINCKGSQGQTERAVALKEEEEEFNDAVVLFFCQLSSVQMCTPRDIPQYSIVKHLLHSCSRNST